MTFRDELHQLEVEHGPDLVAAAVRYLPRVIALIKRGKERRVTIALDQAHASLDETLEERIKRGAGHQ